MKHSAEMRRIIRDVDAEAAMRLHAEIFPHLPAPTSEHEARCSLHYARSGMLSMTEQQRCYSHAWLRDWGLPSSLPDYLKPKADRLYPIGARAVGVASSGLSGR